MINLATHIPHSIAKTLLPGAGRENDRIRRISSGLLVNAALAQGVVRFIQESFAPVYAAQGDAWITEESPVKPPRPLPKWVGRLLGSLGELMSRSQRISNCKLREASDWRPRYPGVREGLRATLEEPRKAA